MWRAFHHAVFSRSLRWILVFLLGIGIVASWWHLGQPTTFVFDEQYHVRAARAVVQGDWQIFDWWQPPQTEGIYADWLHPPLFKYLQAGSILLFGDIAFSWRLPSALAGTISLWLVFLLGKKIGGQSVGLLAAVLLAMSGLWLVQSRTGMNDMLVTCLGLSAVVLYADIWLSEKKSVKSPYQLLWVGVLVGLAIATKWSGGFLAIGLLLLEFWRQRQSWRLWPWIICCLFLVPIVVYVCSYAPLWFSGRNTEHFIQLHQAIMQYQTTRDRVHPDQSVPWQWLSNTQSVRYWQAGMAEIKLTELPALVVFEWLGLGWLLSASLVQLRRKTSALSQLPLWIAWLYICWWMPWFFSPRILFYYHYLPAVPILMVIVAWAGKKLPNSLVLIGFLLLFIQWTQYYLIWTGLPVSLDLIQTVYSFLPT
jgi:dolichyl-phosphate-mannose-protein mannosyltransferase